MLSVGNDQIKKNEVKQMKYNLKSHFTIYYYLVKIISSAVLVALSYKESIGYNLRWFYVNLLSSICQI